MYQEWDYRKPPLIVDSVLVDVVDCFAHLGICVNKLRSISSKADARASKARAAFSNLPHLCRRGDVLVLVKGRVYHSTVRSVLLYRG